MLKDMVMKELLAILIFVVLATPPCSLPSTVFLEFLGYMQVIYPPGGLFVQGLVMICPTWHSRVIDEIRC